MISLFLLLFAAASVVVGSDRVSGGLSRRSAGVRLLVGVQSLLLASWSGGPFFISGREVLSSAFW